MSPLFSCPLRVMTTLSIQLSGDIFQERLTIKGLVNADLDFAEACHPSHPLSSDIHISSRSAVVTK